MIYPNGLFQLMVAVHLYIYSWIWFAVSGILSRGVELLQEHGNLVISKNWWEMDWLLVTTPRRKKPLTLCCCLKWDERISSSTQVIKHWSSEWLLVLDFCQCFSPGFISIFNYDVNYNTKLMICETLCFL